MRAKLSIFPPVSQWLLTGRGRLTQCRNLVQGRLGTAFSGERDLCYRIIYLFSANKFISIKQNGN